MLVEETIKQATKVAIGAKQTKKAIEKEEAKLVIMAQDAEERVTEPIKKLCQEKEIEIAEIATMQELGCLCGIDIGSSVVAIIQ